MTSIFAPAPNQELKQAEEDMFAAGLMVDRLQNELDNARLYQKEARDKYIALCGKAVQQ